METISFTLATDRLVYVAIENNTAYSVVYYYWDTSAPLEQGKNIIIPPHINDIPIIVIGEEAFNGYKRLTSISIPDSVKKIEFRAFYGTRLSEISLPKNLEYIGQQVFGKPYEGLEGPNFTNIELPPSLTTIHDRAFPNTLEHILMPDGLDNLMYIAADAFENTAWFLNQPDGLVIIGNVLYTYKGLIPQDTVINVPTNIRIIGENAFCKIENTEDLTFITPQKGLTGILLPPNLIRISKNAFYGSSITSIKIPASVEDIQDAAFSQTESLETIIFEDNSRLISIGKNAFEGSGITEITVPDSVNSIGSFAFAGTIRLTTAVLPDTLKEIPHSLFKGASSLRSFTIPASVETIGVSAFVGTSSLTNLELGSGNAFYKYRWFYIRL